MYKRILAVFLALVLSCTVAIKPMQAQAAEAGILGGALAGMGVTLSVPQIALLVAAAGGAVYLYENREAVAESLETFLDVAAEGLEEKKQQLQDWWNAAKLGHVAISTAQDWIKQGVKNWIAGLHDGSTQPSTSSGGQAYDSKGGILVENGQYFKGIQKVYYTLNDYILADSCQVFKYYNVVKDTSDSFKVRLTVVVMRTNSSYIGYCINGTNVNELTATDNQYYGPYNTGAGLYKTNYLTASTSSEINAIKRLLQGGRSVDSSVASDYRWHAQQDGFEYACNNPITSTLQPDASVGGIAPVISSGYTMDDIYFDDLEFVGYGYITADTTKTGDEVFEESITNTLTGMQAGTITWTDYVTDVSTAPTITVPDTEDETITNDFVIGNTGITDTVVTPTVDPPELEDYKVQLRDFFPFCLPFDIAAFIGCLAAEPEAPCFELTLPWIDGEGFAFTVDLSDWDPVAEIVRTMELLALIVGLCFKTRDLIKG